MTEKQINMAIAYATDWKATTDGGICWGPDNEPIITPPNYCGDLNPMHEAEKVFDTAATDTRSLWLDTLSVVIEWPQTKNAHELRFEVQYGTARATARQRAEAFLRTLNLWTE